jgi:cell filamentation protein
MKRSSEDRTSWTLRYREPEGPEGSFEPGSRGRVLVNLRGIKSKRVMDLEEYKALVAVQSRYYRSLTADTVITVELLCRMHRDWLGSLYEWAGRFRTVELEKGGFRWPPAQRVEESMRFFERDFLKHDTPCRSGSRSQVAGALARLHAELLLIHPFREGNGRLARWLADVMATQAGCPLPEYGLSGRGSLDRRCRYVAAVGQGYLQNYEGLTVFFEEALLRADR